MNATEAQKKLEQGIEALTTSDDWKMALAFSAKFHRYSFGNTLLILIQRPEATRVAGFHRWRQLGRTVKRGERGIAILAPLIFHKVTEDETGERETKTYRRYKVVYVFDVSQTEGKELPPETGSFIRRLTGGDEAERIVFAQLVGFLQNRDWSVRRSTLAGWNETTNGYADFDSKEVHIRTGLSERQSLKTLMHETAHVILHGGIEYLASRPLCEAEAESAAFVASSVLGFDTSDYSFGYVAHWSEGKTELIQQAGANALRAAQEILAAIGEEKGEEDAEDFGSAA